MANEQGGGGQQPHTQTTTRPINPANKNAEVTQVIDLSSIDYGRHELALDQVGDVTFELSSVYTRLAIIDPVNSIVQLDEKENKGQGFTRLNAKNKRVGIHVVCEHEPDEKGFDYPLFGKEHVTKLNEINGLSDKALEAKCAELATHFAADFIHAYIIAPKGCYFGRIKTQDGGIKDDAGNTVFDGGEPIGSIVHTKIGEEVITPAFMQPVRIPRLGNLTARMSGMHIQSALFAFMRSNRCSWRLFRPKIIEVDRATNEGGELQQLIIE
jgi:hypothetical protein